MEATGQGYGRFSGACGTLYGGLLRQPSNAAVVDLVESDSEEGAPPPTRKVEDGQGMPVESLDMNTQRTRKQDSSSDEEPLAKRPKTNAIAKSGKKKREAPTTCEPVPSKKQKAEQIQDTQTAAQHHAIFAKIAEEFENGSDDHFATDAPKEDLSKLGVREKKNLHMFRDALKEGGDASLHSAAGGAWRRFLASKTEEAKMFQKRHDKATTNAEKDQIRKEYFRLMVDTLESKCTLVKTRSYKEIDTSVGHYYSFARIVVEEGGAVVDYEENLQAARVYCTYCLAMGGKWVKYDKMTRRLKFFYVVEGANEELHRCWTIAQEHTLPLENLQKIETAFTGSVATGAAQGSAPIKERLQALTDVSQKATVSATSDKAVGDGKPTAPNAVVGTSKGKGKGTGKGKSKGGTEQVAGGTSQTEPPTADENTPDGKAPKKSTLESEARAIVGKYEKAKTKCENLIDQIKEDIGWKQFNNDFTLGELSSALGKCNEQNSSFVKQLQTLPVATIKASMSEAAFEEGLKTIKSEMGPRLAFLQMKMNTVTSNKKTSDSLAMKLQKGASSEK